MTNGINGEKIYVASYKMFLYFILIKERQDFNNSKN